MAVAVYGNMTFVRAGPKRWTIVMPISPMLECPSISPNQSINQAQEARHNHDQGRRHQHNHSHIQKLRCRCSFDVSVITLNLVSTRQTLEIWRN